MHSPQTALPPVEPNYPAQPPQPTASVDPGTTVPPSQPPRCSTGTLRIRTVRIYASSKCSSVHIVHIRKPLFRSFSAPPGIDQWAGIVCITNLIGQRAAAGLQQNIGQRP